MLFTGSVVLLVRWFVGSWVVGSVCLARVYALGPWGCSWACSCFLAGLVLVVFFCLIRLCRVGVLRWWLELVFFFFFWIIIVFWPLYGVQPLHPRVDMQLCYFPCLARSISVLL
jgi:hypothetical protein